LGHRILEQCCEKCTDYIIFSGRKNRVETFDFALPVPGPAFVGTNVRAEDFYPGKKIEDLELGSLRATFARQACCTTNGDGTRDGDPLNLVIVESKQGAIVPFIARGWHLARQLDVKLCALSYFGTSF
jgi:hypothetical protein